MNRLQRARCLTVSLLRYAKFPERPLYVRTHYLAVVDDDEADFVVIL
jgi:hypothetical protein